MGGSWAKRKEDKSSMASSLTENKSSRKKVSTVKRAVKAKMWLGQ